MKIKSFLVVEIQGFFTERFINICKINNIKIWDIINITSGIVRFKISPKSFKLLKKAAKKTKCKVKIKEKNGLYFNFMRYKKRKWFLVIGIAIIFMFIISTTFIWSIDIESDYVDKDKVKEALSSYGINTRHK